MYTSEKIILTDPRGNNYSLSNRFKDIIKLKDFIEDAKNAQGLVKNINKLSTYGTWDIYKDGKDVTIFKSVDALGNVEYLKVSKEGAGKPVFTKVRLTNPSNVNFALSNDFKDETELKEDIKDCKTVKDLIQVVNKNALYKKVWSLDRETSNKVRLTSKDPLGNIHYLELVKESVDMNESFDKIRVPDLSDQPMTPSGVGGGMPTRWVWAEYGRFLNAYGIRNGFNITFNLESALDIKNKLAYLYQKRDEGLINSDDLQELEERLRTMSDFVIGGNDNQSGAAIEEIEYDDMANEAVKPSTSEKQLKHLEEIRPLSQTPEAKAKRAKTLIEKKARKMINVIDEDDLKK